MNFLNSIDLNQNELLHARIENQASDALAGTGVDGQLYYNTTVKQLKAWDASILAWVEVGGGVVSLTSGTYLTDTGTAEDPIVNHDNTTRSDTTSAASPASSGTFEVVDSATTNATGHVTAINVKTITLPIEVDTTYDLTTAPTGTAVRLTDSGAASDDVTISGTANEITLSRVSGTELNVALPDDVTIGNDLTVTTDLEVQGASSIQALSVNSNKISNVLDPTTPQDAATKQYVDDVTAGGLVYQTGYNATTNSPDLDSATSIAVEKGWTYTVTADGDFFNEKVRVGDVLIAEIDLAIGAGTLADWTTVQNNIDLAGLSTVGIGNVNAGTGIDVSYASGTASVSLTAASASGTIAIGATTGTVTHALGANVLVQTFENVGGDTVFCDIARTATTVTATVATASATTINIIVQKIG